MTTSCRTRVLKKYPYPVSEIFALEINKLNDFLFEFEDQNQLTLITLNHQSENHEILDLKLADEGTARALQVQNAFIKLNYLL
jgi:hypothetical protein